MTLVLGEVVFTTDEICRLCLQKEKPLLSIKNIDNYSQISLADMISAIGSIPVSENDNFPSQICSECKQKLTLCYIFKQSILKSFEFLRRTVETNDSIQCSIKNEKSLNDCNEVNSFSAVSQDDPIFPTKSTKVKLSRKQKPIKVKTDAANDKVIAALQKLLKNRDKCPLCLLTMKENETMVDHFYSHYAGSNLTPLIVSGEKVKTCNLCNKTLKYNVMVPHHRTHLKIYPFKCEMEDCEQGFVSAQYLSTHLDRHDGSKKYQCQTCGKTFLLRGSLTTHEESHVVEDARCEICNKTYKNNTMLKFHMKRHQNGLKFKCDHHGCSKGFRLVQELNRHRKMHTSGREHVCSTCSKGFFTAAQLRRHEQFHLAVRKHKCSHCYKTFAEGNQLRLHEMTHTGERPHVCEFCSMTFVERYKLKRHQMKSCKVAKELMDSNNPNKD